MVMCINCSIICYPKRYVNPNTNFSFIDEIEHHERIIIDKLR